MKVAFITPFDAGDILNRSGSVFFMGKSLKHQGISLSFISYSTLGEKDFFFRVKRQYYKRVLNKRFSPFNEPSWLKLHAIQISKKLSSLNPDIVFSPIPFSIAYLECDKPIVTWTDGSFVGSIDFIPSGCNLSKDHIKKARRIEQAALEKCSLAIYSNNWAAEETIKNYDVDPKKIKVIPFGANIEIEVGRNLEDIKRMVDSRPTNICNLLFLAGEWINKRGDIVVKIAETLNRMGLPTELSIVGVEPKMNGRLPEFIHIYGFIDKSTESGLAQIKNFLAQSHFMIIPSWAECAPCQFREASAFGVPSIGTNVGGVSTVLKNGINGKLFDRNASVEEYSMYILNLFSNYSQYRELALSSFNEYRSRLNWAVVSKTIKTLMQELVL